MIPDDVRQWIEEQIAEMYAVPGAPLFKEYDVVKRAEEWLDNQPTVPEPDWSQAPEDAQHHAIAANGWGAYYGDEVRMTDDQWWSDDGPLMWDKHYDLPIGIDWRTTLRERPK